MFDKWIANELQRRARGIRSVQVHHGVEERRLWEFDECDREIAESRAELSGRPEREERRRLLHPELYRRHYHLAAAPDDTVVDGTLELAVLCAENGRHAIALLPGGRQLEIVPAARDETDRLEDARRSLAAAELEARS